jgi:hypothetical protein
MTTIQHALLLHSFRIFAVRSPNYRAGYIAHRVAAGTTLTHGNFTSLAAPKLWCISFSGLALYRTLPERFYGVFLISYFRGARLVTEFSNMQRLGLNFR